MIADQVLAAWEVAPVAVRPLGRGHIHGTWRVDSATGTFVLQRINQRVFPRWGRLIRNMQLLEGQLAAAPGFIPHLLTTAAGYRWARGSDDSIWRLTRWIDHALCPDGLTSDAQGRAIGWAFGRFQRLTTGLEARLRPAIDGFLDLQPRLAALAAARRDGSASRRAELGPVLALVDALRPQVEATFPQGQALVHGDCKVNNVLLGADGQVRAVVDLDTVSIASPALDFGDLARSATALMAEDEGDPGRVAFSTDRFLALAGGFIAGASSGSVEAAAAGGGVAADGAEADGMELDGMGADGTELDGVEADGGRGAAVPASAIGSLDATELVDAAIGMSYMLGIRSATDYLTGDWYFRPARATGNRDRTVAQINLANAFVDARHDLISAIDTILAAPPSVRAAR